MSDTVEVREPSRVDLPLIQALYSAVKGRARPAQYDEWHLFDTPWGSAPALAAFLDGACVGLYVMRPAALALGSESVLGVQALDVMVHPDHRRRGAFSRLAAETVEMAEARGFELAYGFPNEVSLPLYVRFRNADHVGDITSWVTYPRPPRLPRPLRSRDGEIDLRGLTLDIGRPPADELDVLVASAHAEADVCRIAKTPAYLEWRYSAASGETCDWIALRNATGALVGVAVAGERDSAWEGDSPRIARIHEVFGTRAEDVELLVLIATARAALRGAVKVQMLVKDPLIEAGLQRTALRPESVVSFVVRKLTTRIQAGNVHHFPYWRFLSGDLDFY